MREDFFLFHDFVRGTSKQPFISYRKELANDRKLLESDPCPCLLVGEENDDGREEEDDGGGVQRDVHVLLQNRENKVGIERRIFFIPEDEGPG